MKFQEDYAYPAAFDRIWQMYQDPDYTVKRLAAAHLDDAQVQVKGDDSKFRVEVSALIPASDLPSVAQRFVKSDVQVTLVEEWTRSGTDAATGTSQIVAKGAPVSFTSQSTLTGAGNETQRSMSGDVKVSIPLVGGRIEKEAVKYVPRLVQGELDASSVWLEQHA
ncbi:DUF2505 domain-containing protein [Scrofimicrobium canadense]|nr:DUF2505 domain-containing protein [Scrofimicrobium canadense]